LLNCDTRLVRYPCQATAGIGSFVLADGAVNRKNWDGREGPNVATWPTLTHACPKKGCPPSQGTAALKQHAQ